MRFEKVKVNDMMGEVIKKINDAVAKILIKNWKMGTVDGGIRLYK